MFIPRCSFRNNPCPKLIFLFAASASPRTRRRSSRPSMPRSVPSPLASPSWRLGSRPLEGENAGLREGLSVVRREGSTGEEADFKLCHASKLCQLFLQPSVVTSRIKILEFKF